MATKAPNYPTGLTFEKVWASIQELKEFQKESTRQRNEDIREMRESSTRLDKQLGDLGNRFGELAEHLVGPSIREKFNDAGFNFTQLSKNIDIKFPDDPNSWAEIDYLLENGDIVIAIEIKATPKEKDVDKHVNRMEVLRRAANKRGDKRKFRGAIAGAIMSREICQYILQNGFYLIEQTGDTVRLTIPENFTPKEW